MERGECLSTSEYLQNRVDDQIAWYDRKSVQNQRWYRVLRVMELVAATSIPFFVGYITNTSTFLKILVGLLGLLVAVITGLVSLCHFQELWLQYRVTCEALKHEKYLFLTKTEPYDTEQAFPLLVKRVEALTSEEQTRWVHHLKSTKKEGNNG